jgi:hypothetical protein
MLCRGFFHRSKVGLRFTLRDYGASVFKNLVKAGSGRRGHLNHSRRAALRRLLLLRGLHQVFLILVDGAGVSALAPGGPP